MLPELRRHARLSLPLTIALCAILFGCPQPSSAQFDDLSLSGSQPVPGAQNPFPPLGAPSAFDAQPGVLPGLGDLGLPAVSAEPPPLVGSLGLLAEVTTDTEGTTAPAGGLITTFVFLYRDDPEMGIVREIYTQEEATEQMEKEFARLAAMREAPAPGQQQQSAGPTQVADRATVEWDFYFEQLQMFDEYVKKKILPGVENLPGPTYDTSNFLAGVVEERTRLKEEFNKASVGLQVRLTQQNTEFYERLDRREDKRRNFLEWIDEKQEELIAWAEHWGKNIEAQNFRAGNAVTTDQWYAGANYGNPNPMVAQAGNRTILVTKSPDPETPRGMLNVVSGNLTPYDLLDPFGRPKPAGGQDSIRMGAPAAPGLVLLDSPEE